MKYNRFEDKAIQILRVHLSDQYMRPQWSRIVDFMNDHREALNSSKGPKHEYTVSMLRNRHERMTKCCGKRKRNTCTKCGQLIRGHACLGECIEDDADDVVYNLLGFYKPLVREDDNWQMLAAVDSNANEEFMAPMEEHELDGLFEVFKSLDEDPKPISEYKAVWDDV